MSQVQILFFNSTELDVISQNGQAWIKSTQLAIALGYKRADEITRLYSKNQDEFTQEMTQVIEILDNTVSVVTKNLTNKVRIFSLRGCHLIAMFARTAVAKAFRGLGADIIEKHNTPSSPADHKPLKSIISV